MNIWNLGLFCFLSNEVYGIESFITWFPFVVHVSTVADASQLVLSHTAGSVAAISWEVFSFLGYTHRADFWINVLAQVFSCVLNFYGSFFFSLHSQFYYISFESVFPYARMVKLRVSNDLNIKEKMPLSLWHKDVKKILNVVILSNILLSVLFNWNRKLLAAL